MTDVYRFSRGSVRLEVPRTDITAYGRAFKLLDPRAQEVMQACFGEYTEGEDREAAKSRSEFYKNLAFAARLEQRVGGHQRPIIGNPTEPVSLLYVANDDKARVTAAFANQMNTMRLAFRQFNQMLMRSDSEGVRVLPSVNYLTVTDPNQVVDVYKLLDTMILQGADLGTALRRTTKVPLGDRKRIALAVREGEIRTTMTKGAPYGNVVVLHYQDLQTGYGTRGITVAGDVAEAIIEGKIHGGPEYAFAWSSLASGRGDIRELDGFERIVPEAFVMSQVPKGGDSLAESGSLDFSKNIGASHAAMREELKRKN